MADLTICPREDCTATYRHWHCYCHEGARVCVYLPGPCEHVESSDDSEACHEPRPQADLTEPVDLPTAEELAKAMYRAIYGPPILTDPFAAASGYARRRYLAASEAALALIRERLAPAIEWQPIDFADIKVGMRVRKETPAVDARLTVTSIGSIGCVCANGSCAYDSPDAVWSVDPRTVPKPEDPRVERVAKALYEAGRDSTRPDWQDVTDKTRDKHLKRARAAVAAIDEAVESDD